MPVVLLIQQNTHEGQWQKLVGRDANADAQTGPMTSCISAVYIGGADVRGYHGGGGFYNINFADLHRTIPDVPHTKIVIALGLHHGSPQAVNDAVHCALRTIKYYGFKNLQWEFYWPPGGNAIITRAGVVTDADSKQPVPRLRAFISKIAPGLDQISYDDAIPAHDWVELQRLKKRPLPPIPQVEELRQLKKRPLPPIPG
jgi:hypothetical protein